MSNQTTYPAPDGWTEVLAESEADLASGDIVSGEIVRREMRDSIAALEATFAERLGMGEKAAR